MPKIRHKLTPEEMKEIETCGFLDCDIGDIAIVLKKSRTWLDQLSRDTDNAVQLEKKRGKLKSKMLAERKLMEKIQLGDLEAVKFYLSREEKRQQRREDKEFRSTYKDTMIHVTHEGNLENKPQVLISIPSNGREPNH